MRIGWFILLLAIGARAWAEPVQLVTENSPYTYMENGRLGGAATRVVEAVLAEAGLTDYTAGLYPWARAYDIATHEPNALIFLIARTAAREHQFKWVGELMGIRYRLYKLKERSDIQVNSLNDARDYSVGVLRDDVRYHYLKSQGFTKLVLSAQAGDNFQKFLNQQVQLIALTRLDALSRCQQANFDCDQLEEVALLNEQPIGLYMAYSLATSDEVVERTRAAFETLKASTPLLQQLPNP